MKRTSKAADKRHWQQWTEADAQSALEELAGSGLSLAAFARSKGISRQRVAYWKKRVAHDGGPAFVRVALPGGETSSTRSQVEILAGGVVLRVREEIDAERLACIVDALDRRQRAC